MTAEVSRRGWLVASLLGLLLIYPYATRGPVGKAILVLANSATIVAGVYAVSERRRDWVFAAVVGAAQASVAVTDLALESRELSSIAVALLALFYGFALARTLQLAIRPGPVTSDRLYAAVAVYLLFGLLFACLYTLAADALPEAFASTDGGFPDMAYFSFVTLTTLGYGDILPLAKQVRSLAIVEAVCGVLYLALLVARLIGLHIAAEELPNSKGSNANV